MRALLWAVVRRWLHCLFRLHRSVIVQAGGGQLYLGCDCGRVFYDTCHPTVKAAYLQYLETLRESRESRVRCVR
jgi:hypothetical protein